MRAEPYQPESPEPQDCGEGSVATGTGCTIRCRIVIAFFDGRGESVGSVRVWVVLGV